MKRPRHSVDVSSDHTRFGSPVRYLDEPVTAYGLAFDECGNLYVSDGDRGRILRVPLGGGSYEALLNPSGSEMFNAVGLAFGQDPYDSSSLYFMDVISPSAARVVRIPLGVRGAAVVLPP